MSLIASSSATTGHSSPGYPFAGDERSRAVGGVPSGPRLGVRDFQKAEANDATDQLPD